MKTLDEFRAVYRLPLPELILKAAAVHRTHRDYNDIQRCDCSASRPAAAPRIAAIAARRTTTNAVDRQPLLSVEEVRERAEAAKERGASRFCMGAAWRVAEGRPRSSISVLDMVQSACRDLGMEACVTLGMLTDEQAQRLADAGLTAYNHNLDTSRRHYPEVITTRTYDDRLDTLQAVSQGRHLRLLRRHHRHGRDRGRPPDDARANWRTSIRRRKACRSTAWCRIAGTPLAMAPPVDSLELVRLIATARIAFPKARVRLSAGRDRMSRELQVLCFLAGAKSDLLRREAADRPEPARMPGRRTVPRHGRAGDVIPWVLFTTNPTFPRKPTKSIGCGSMGCTKRSCSTTG